MVEHLLWEQDVAGSNPAIQTIEINRQKVACIGNLKFLVATKQELAVFIIGVTMTDYTDKYNSYLPKDKEELYELWLKAFPKEQQNTYDYDMIGAFIGGVQSGENNHLPDTYKKPNHPTFSVDSQYHGSNGRYGGRWIELTDGNWLFVPSQTNWNLNGDWLEDYFKMAESKGFLPQELID